MRGVLHDADADVAGELVGQKAVAVIDGTGQNRAQTRQSEFQRNPPPEVVRQGLLARHVGHDGIDDPAGHRQHREGNQRGDNPQHAPKRDHHRARFPHHVDHGRDILKGPQPFVPSTAKCSDRCAGSHGNKQSAVQAGLAAEGRGFGPGRKATLSTVSVPSSLREKGFAGEGCYLRRVLKARPSAVLAKRSTRASKEEGRGKAG